LVERLPGLVAACRAKGEAETVHELRVTLRRLRLYVRVGRPQFRRKRVAEFRAWARGVSKLTSPVRDLDVALEWLEPRPVAQAVAARCRRRRRRLWAAAQRRLEPSPDGVIEVLAATRGGVKRRKEIELQFEALLDRYRRAVVRDLPRFFRLSFEAQHGFRRALRWWRYCRELELPAKAQGSDPLLAALVALQEATGTRQNLRLAAAALRGQRGPAAAGLREAIRRELATQEAAIRRAASGERRAGGE
jgi:CHAD domain-containing protein